MNPCDIDKAARDILALVRGEPGPFFETETSYFASWGAERQLPGWRSPAGGSSSTGRTRGTSCQA